MSKTNAITDSSNVQIIVDSFCPPEKPLTTIFTVPKTWIHCLIRCRVYYANLSGNLEINLFIVILQELFNPLRALIQSNQRYPPTYLPTLPVPLPPLSLSLVVATKTVP